MWEPAGEKGGEIEPRGERQQPAPDSGYVPPPVYSHERLEARDGEQPSQPYGEQRHPALNTQPSALYKDAEIEVYPSYEAYLAAQGQGQGRDLRGVVDDGADRTLSAVAHGAIAFGIFGIGLLVSLAISGFLWLYSKRSRAVRFHAEQAGCYQVIVLLVNGLAIVGLAAAGGFSVFQNWNRQSDYGAPWLLCGGLLLFAVWFFVTIGYGLFGAVQVLRGKEFKYPLIGKWAKKRIE